MNNDYTADQSIEGMAEVEAQARMAFEIARAARRTAMEELRANVKKSPYSYSAIASSCGKSQGWIGEVLRGNYPYFNACQLPKYLRVWLQERGFTVDARLITF